MNSFKNHNPKPILNMLKLFPRAFGLIWRCDWQGASAYFAVISILGLLPYIQISISKKLIDAVIFAISHTHHLHHSEFAKIYYLLGYQGLIWIISGMLTHVQEISRTVQSAKLQHYIDRLILGKATTLDVAFLNRKSSSITCKQPEINLAGARRDFLFFSVAYYRRRLPLFPCLR